MYTQVALALMSHHSHIHLVSSNCDAFLIVLVLMRVSKNTNRQSYIVVLPVNTNHDKGGS